MQEETVKKLTQALNSKRLNGKPIQVTKIVSFRKSRYGYQVWFETKDQDPFESNTLMHISFDEMENIKCTHPETYVAVRHVSGIKIVKCKSCNKIVE